MLIIYTDGSCDVKTRCGGWAYIVYDSETTRKIYECSGSEVDTTNNRMELTAVINAMKYVSEEENMKIFVDSAYIFNCMTIGWYIKWTQNNWKTTNGKDVLNRDLWEELISIFYESDKNISFSKVAGHIGTNIEVDKLAHKAMQRSRGDRR